MHTRAIFGSLPLAVTLLLSAGTVDPAAAASVSASHTAPAPSGSGSHQAGPRAQAAIATASTLVATNPTVASIVSTAATTNATVASIVSTAATNATVATTTAGMSGIWAITLSDSYGSFPVLATITDTNGALTGTVTVPTATASGTLTGTVTGTAVTMTVSYTGQQVGTVTVLTMTGTVNGRSASGTCYEMSYTVGTWSGTQLT